MDEKTKAEISDLIRSEIKKTLGLIAEYEEMTKPIAPDDAIGRVSRMDAINNKSVNEAALRQAELKLKKLEIVNNDLDNPNFGLCFKCRQEIPIQRIIRMPQSRLCVNCAS